MTAFGHVIKRELNLAFRQHMDSLMVLVFLYWLSCCFRSASDRSRIFWRVSPRVSFGLPLF